MCGLDTNSLLTETRQRLIILINFVAQKTGARIKIYSSCCPDSTDRVVQLTGAGNTAIDCLKEILELIRTVSGHV